MKLNQIKPNPNNPRLIKDDKFRKLCNSISEFPKMMELRPMVIDVDGVILGGNMRYKALKELGYKEIPDNWVKVADELTKEEQRRFIIEDNVGFGEWDWADLGDNWSNADLSAWGLDMPSFSDLMKEGSARQENTAEYDAFVEKFQYKKTTDDCYTPQNIYDAIADKVAERFSLDKSKFVRPFRPCGDYQAEKYPEDCVVVDNPPFSIFSQIVDWYHEHGVKFFLFCSADSCFGANREWMARYPTYSPITYENGANVRTSFVSNLEDDIAIFNWPELTMELKRINDANRKNEQRELARNQYDPHFVIASRLGDIAEEGVEFVLKKGQFVRASKIGDYDVYGGCLIVSDSTAKEYSEKLLLAKTMHQERKQEKEPVLLSPTEKEQAIIDELNKLD